jgi:flagellar basal-body rod protein FlgG
MSTYGIYTSGLGALGQSLKLDQIANNLANVSTPGYRRDRISFRERLVQALEGNSSLHYYNAQVDRYGGAPYVDQVTYDRQGGSTEVTQRPLDLAILSDGFFTVQDLKTGNVYYTRAGNFTLDPQGRILTADRHFQLLSDDGRGMSVNPTGEGDLRIRDGATLAQGENEIGRAGIVTFLDPSRVHKYGDNLFQNDGSPMSTPSDPRLVQGALEQSTVNPISEMVEMIRTMRTLESNLEMVRQQDQTLDKTVNDMGRQAR